MQNPREYPRSHDARLLVTSRVVIGATTSISIDGGGYQGLYLVRVGRKQGSMTLEADGKHLLSDTLTSVAVLDAGVPASQGVLQII